MIENDLVAKAVSDFVTTNSPWEGSASELLGLLTTTVAQRIAESRLWPQTPAALGRRLRRVAPALRSVGIDIDFGYVGKDRTRLIRLDDTRADSGGR